MCDKVFNNGILIRGTRQNYKVCKYCLEKYTTELQVPKLYASKKVNERNKTIKRGKYIQEKVDEKLNHYLLEE